MNLFKKRRKQTVLVAMALVATIAVCSLHFMKLYRLLRSPKSIEVAVLSNDRPGKYDRYDLSGHEMDLFLDAIDQESTPLFIQVKAILGSMIVRLFNDKGDQIGSVVVYPRMDRPSPAFDTLAGLARKGRGSSQRRQANESSSMSFMRQLK